MTDKDYTDEEAREAIAIVKELAEKKHYFGTAPAPQGMVRRILAFNKPPERVVKHKGRSYRKLMHLMHGHFGVWRRDDDGYLFFVHSSIEPFTMGNPGEWPSDPAMFWVPPYAAGQVVEATKLAKKPEAGT